MKRRIKLSFKHAYVGYCDFKNQYFISYHENDTYQQDYIFRNGNVNEPIRERIVVMDIVNAITFIISRVCPKMTFFNLSVDVAQGIIRDIAKNTCPQIRIGGDKIKRQFFKKFSATSNKEN